MYQDNVYMLKDEIFKELIERGGFQQVNDNVVSRETRTAQRVMIINGQRQVDPGDVIKERFEYEGEIEIEPIGECSEPIIESGFTFYRGDEPSATEYVTDKKGFMRAFFS